MGDNLPILSTSEINRAPWNFEEKEPIKIPVTVSITLSKTMDVYVNDYETTTDWDEEGPISNNDYSNCNLYSAVKEQILLPNELYNVVKGTPYESEDLKDWNVDDFEVINEL